MKLSSNLKQVTFAQRTKTTLSRLRKQRGITLVEVGLAIAVSAIVIVAGLSIYNSTNQSAKTLTLEKDVMGIFSAAINASAGGTAITSIAALDVPQTTPWGGAYTVDTSNATYVEITAAAVPDKQCTAAANYFTGQDITNGTPSCASNTVTVQLKK